MDRSTTGSISCTFTATNDVGQTASASATANVTRPPPPWVTGAYSPANIEAGQQSQLLYNSGNATVIGLVCDGLSFAAVQTPSMLLNQAWYWGMQTWSTPGTQSCGISAHNSLGEVAIVYFDLVVGPAGFAAPSGGGSDGQLSYPAGDPRNPPPTGSSSTSGHPMGYFNPATGLTYSDPGGTQVCGNCGTDPGTQVNANDNPGGDPDNPGGGSPGGGEG